MKTNACIERIAVGDRVVIYPRGRRRTWTAEFSLNGRHTRKSLKTSKKRTALQRATGLAAKLEAGTYAAEVATTIREATSAYLAYLKTEGRAPKTITRYQGELNRFGDFAETYGVRKLSRVSLGLLDAYRAERITDHDPSTVCHETVVIKQLLKWSRRRGLIGVNPIAGYELTKPQRKRKSVLTLEQVNAILAECTPRQRRMIAMLAFTGMRVSSLQVQRRDGVNLRRGWLDVWDVKKKQRVKLPIHPRLEAILRGVPRGDHDLLFTAQPSRKYPEGGRPISSKRLGEYFKAASARVGITGFTLHSLRHFFKSFTVNAGVPERAVDQWLGHSDGSVRGVYYHLTDAESRHFMDSVPFGTEPGVRDDDGDQNDPCKERKGDG